MPFDYSKYPKNWKSEIRPAVLLRAENKCECCKVPNSTWVCRGKWGEIPVYQDDDCYVYSAIDGTKITQTYMGDLDGTTTFSKIVLTIAHLDHDTTNNDMGNLKAMCQRCHLNYDKELHAQNRKATLKKKRGTLELFEQ